MIHEVSHGVVALRLGDTTARDMGRLTLNPLKHLDPIGSFLLPLILAISHAPIIGWAKPVPYNPYNLRDPKKGAALISVAGPLSNISLALVFGAFLRILSATDFLAFDSFIFTAFTHIVLVNIALAVFNLIPIPPLDGSKVFFAILPPGYSHIEAFLSQYGFFIIIFLLFVTGFNFIAPVIFWIYALIVGAPF